MNDRLAAVLIRLMTPYEKWWGRHVRRLHAKGKFRRPADPSTLALPKDPRSIGKPAIVARQKRDAA